MLWRRGLVLVMVLAALPLAAQDKKSDAKDTSNKKDEKKPNVAAKYHVVNHVTAKLTNSDNQEMLVEVEMRVPSGRYGRNEKVTFKVASDVKVRNLRLPDKHDDKGKSIPYTPQEKSKLRGDNPKLPGYATDMNSLKSGQIVELELSTNKPPNAAGKKGAEDDEKPFVTMIVINEEAPQKIEKKKK